MDPRRILMVSSEVAPFAKTGGLADVAAGLTAELHRRGDEVRLLMPLYPRVRKYGVEPVPGLSDLEFDLGARRVRCAIRRTELPGSEAHVWLLESPDFFEREGIYTQDPDEHLRFAALCRAALEACQQLGWAPDVVHCNDWHTGLLPLYLKSHYGWDSLFENTRSLLSIHNIGYQGDFPAAVVDELGLGNERGLLHQGDLGQGKVGFLKTGLIYADALSTVSETYAREIQTAEFGMGLDEMLRARADRLVGIVNGIDYGTWDPEVDPHLAQNYGPGDFEGKAANKRALLEQAGLPLDEETPLFGIVSRFTAQKGFELLPDILPVLLSRRNMRLVVLGSGDRHHEDYFAWLARNFPDKVANHNGYDESLAHRIEAGADAFLMPSRYEPCGLNQMYSLKYGTVPVVRRTGGLADTVQPFRLEDGSGTGFVFEEYSAEGLKGSIEEALATYEHRDHWRAIMRNGMARDTSWNRQAPLYQDLYDKLGRL